jgi:anti-sigma factor RsiW
MTALPQRFGTDGPGSDPYAEWDAAYVLGALAPAERLEFEGHLAGCTRCRASVAEIAGLPGLLAQVGPEDAAALTEAPDPHDGIPATVMPEVLATVRRQRGRLTRLLVGLAAAVVLVLAGLGLGQALGAPGPDEPQQLAFTPVAPSFITANVSLVPVGSGTDVQVECQYSGATDPDPLGHYARYSIVVTDRAGHATAIKDWPISAHKVMRPSATTPLPVDQIRAVEIRETATNATVLRAQPR